MKSPVLKSSTEDSVKVEPGVKKHILKFIQRLKEDARACQALEKQVGLKDPPYKNAGLRSKNILNIQTSSKIKKRSSHENRNDTQKAAKLAPT